MSKYKTKVHYLDVNYDFRPSQGQVICTLNFFVNLNDIPCIETLWNNPKFKSLLSKFRIYDFCDGTYPDVETTVMGYADTKDGDKYDAEFGRKLALTRAQAKAFNITQNFLNVCSNIILSLVFDDRLEDFGNNDNGIMSIERIANNCFYTSERCNEHVKTLINRKYNDISSI